MAQRIRVALAYTEDKNWVAGSYYILNLIHALKTLEDQRKPELFVLSTSPEEFEEVRKTGYPYLNYHLINEKDFWPSYSIMERLLNKMARVILRRNLISREVTQKRLKLKVDILFPASNFVYFSSVKNRLFWIPDFQERFLPQFFSEEERRQRQVYQEGLEKNGSTIVFSSNNAEGHFKKFYPGSSSVTYVLPFAVTHPDFDSIPIGDLYAKFNINRPYFFCPNQFWAHKNHILVLKAIKSMKENGRSDVLVVFSGKEFDQRNPDFFEQLKKYVSENGLGECVHFLGFIDRREQLQLMKNALGMIQPSLFEGWSTSIEDAKSMSQFVIASALDIHKEQLADNCVFFDPSDEKDLAAKLTQRMGLPSDNKKMNYKKNVEDFGTRFLEIVTDIISRNNNNF